MPVIKTRGLTRKRQPQSPAALDKTNPLSKGFTSFLYTVSGKLYDACAPTLLVGTPTAVTGGNSPGGRTREFNGTSSNINYGDVESVNFPGAYSIFVLFRPGAQTGARREMLLAKDSSTGRQFTVELNPAGVSGSADGQTASIGHTRFVTNSTFYQVWSAANTVTNGKWYSLLIGSTDGSTNMVAYLNGVALTLAIPGIQTGLMQNTTTALTAGTRVYTGFEDFFQGGIAAIGIANVAPSAALAKALFENPFQLLQKPQRETPVGFASSGGSVTADQIHALEWLANIGNSALTPFGYSGSLAASAQPPVGFLATAAADIQTPAEWLAGIVRDAVSGVEYRGALAADSLANIDYAALLRADNAALVEFGLTARADHVSPADWLATVQRDAVAPVEWTGGVLVTADAALPIEWRSTVSADGVMPISISQVLAVNQSMPVEFGAGVVRDQAAALEWLASIGANALLPLSTIAVVRGDQAIMAEWGGTAAAAAFVSGNINVFHLDARGTVWHLDARGTVWKIIKH